MTIKDFNREVKNADGTTYIELKASGKFNADGQPLPEIDKDGNAVQVTLKFSTLIGSILKNGFKDENLSSDEYIGRWNLMIKLAEGGESDYSDSQITLIRDSLIKSRISPFIIGQILSYLNEK